MPVTDSEKLAQLQNRLRECDRLPSPPGLVDRLLSLADDSGATMADFAEIVQLDVNLSGQILRLANSPVYGLRREVATVHQAVTLIGLTATLNNAVSLLLLSSMRSFQSAALDYGHFWRRATGTAAACRQLARNRREPNAESFFMAGLIQDIGMLALDAVEPELYAPLGQQQRDHRKVVSQERQVLGVDHASIGAWLINEWNLPEHYCQAILASHEPQETAVDPEHISLARSVALGALVADILYGHDQRVAIDRTLALGAVGEELTAEILPVLLERVAEELTGIAQVFELDLGDAAWLETRRESAVQLLSTSLACAPKV